MAGWEFLFVIVYFGLTGTIRPARNVSTVLTWSLWWPLLPFFLLLLARFWCAVCPLGSVADLIQRIGWRPGRMPGRYFRRYGVWIMVASLVILTWVDRVFGIVGSPRLTAWLLIILLAGAAAMALVYARRAWCRYVCPLGALTGLYSMTAPVDLRADQSVCRSKCRTHDCYRGNAKTPGCPFYEFPMTLESNRNCNLCGNCVKSCRHDALRLRPRAPGQDFWKLRSPVLGEALLAVLMVALVYIQTIDMTLNYAAYMRWFMSFSGIMDYNLAFTATFFGGIAVGLGAYALACLASSRPRGQRLGDHLSWFGYSYAALALAGHLAHNLSHLVGEGRNAIQVAAQQIGLQVVLVSPDEKAAMPDMAIWTVGVVVAGLAGATYASWRVARGRSKDGPLAAFIPHAVLLLTMAAVFAWTLLLPMNPRHSH